MDELLSVFIETYFVEEVQDEIAKSFDLFDYFEYNQAYSGLINIANEHGQISTDDLQDRFTAELHAKLDYIVTQHAIKLVDTTTLSQKNEILTALAHLQKLIDYTPVLRTLETFADDIEQLSSILSEMTYMEEAEVHSLIESVDPSMLRTLKTYAYQREEELESSEEPNYNLVENIKIFNEFTQNRGLGSVLLNNGTLPGERFRTYIPFIEDLVVVPNNDAATALNFLSTLLLSSDGYNATLLAYRKYSFQLLHDLNLVSKVEVKLLDLIGQYTEFKKVHYEKIRLSETGTTA
jgi:hypothetical protein